jgi:hypothetical protein
LEAHIESLTQQNAELLRRRPKQPNPEMNRDEREEEDHNNNTNPQREDDRQGDLSRVIAELENVHVHEDGKKGQKLIRSGGQAPNEYRLTFHQTGGRLSASREV